MRLRTTDPGYQARPLWRWLFIDSAVAAGLVAVFFCIVWALMEAM